MSGLTVEDLSVTIGTRKILEAVSFSLSPGEIVGLIGPNGAGKSTALRAVLGFIAFEAARIDMDGRDVRALSARERAKFIAYLPQARDVHWPISAHALVALGRSPHGDAESPRGQEAISRALEQTDASEFASRNVLTLSGGELARVLLARAFAVEAPVLFADEPLASLDPGHQLQVMEHLRAAAKTSSVLIVMHDLALAARYCDRLYLLDKGRVMASGAASEVIASPATEAAFEVRLLRSEIGGVPLIAATMR
ncbi:MAG: ABC transporter ATP-binding protein [Alphaproteobacteria bacterium]